MKVDRSHFQECLLELLSDMFGSECVNPMIRNNKMTMIIDDKTIYIDLVKLVGICCFHWDGGILVQHSVINTFLLGMREHSLR